MAEKIKVSLNSPLSSSPLSVKLNSVVSGGKVTMPLPTIVQTQGLPEKDALVFIGECADGKRKIAKAVKQKYETITEEESGITEYSTFDELSNKINDIPIEVPLGSAMEQNGGVLTFYDVYNELVKASKQYTEYPYCCAMELDKWDYDNDHKITLSGADAYLTSDGVYLRSSEVNGEYQFTDIDQPNTNRFVVYFFGSTPYQVPKSLPATSVFGLWCLKGTPLMNFSNDFTRMNNANVYDGDLDVKEENDFKFYNIALIQKLRLPHIKSVSGGSQIISSNTYLREISLPNLITISGGDFIFSTNAQLINVTLPKLTTISSGTNIFNSNAKLREITLPNLTTISGGSNIFYSNTALREITLPNLTTISGGSNIFYSNTALREITLPNLTTISGGINIFYNSTNLESIQLPNLKVVGDDSNPQLIFISTGMVTLQSADFSSLEEIRIGSTYGFLINIKSDKVSLPKLHICTNLYRANATTIVPIVELGDGMRDGVAGDIKILGSGTQTTLTTLIVAKGFKAKLNLTGCNGLEREVLVDILNNLSDLTGEASLNLIMGATLLAKLTDADKAIATQKNWTLS